MKYNGQSPNALQNVKLTYYNYTSCLPRLLFIINPITQMCVGEYIYFEVLWAYVIFYVIDLTISIYKGDFNNGKDTCQGKFEITCIK